MNSKNGILIGVIVAAAVLVVLFWQKDNLPIGSILPGEKMSSTSTSITPTSTPSTLPDGSEQIFCTADVKLCPDGSYVSRTPPTCQFKACPATPAKSTVVYVEVLLGPTCPVERIPPDPNCAPKPYLTSVDVYSDANLVTSRPTDGKGKVTFYLSYGAYKFIPRSGNPYPLCKEESFEISGPTQNITLSCDTGIR
ncbi:MAG TPA: hypothetical protein VJC12_01665 [Candidatus Paceibacterota bacterium]